MNWAERVKKRLTDTVIQESLRVAARDILAPMAVRIFEEGKNGQGSAIGEYSTKKIYTWKPAMPKIVGGIMKKKTVLWVEGKGYKAYKTALGEGRGPRVNLFLFGRFQSAFLSMGEKLSGKTLTLTLKDESEQDKHDGFLKKYGDVFKMTKSELARTTNTFNFEFSRRIFQE
jgi:hypothetical protein